MAVSVEDSPEEEVKQRASIPLQMFQREGKEMNRGKLCTGLS